MIEKLFQTQCPILAGTLLVCAVTLLSGCNQSGFKSPEGYNLNKPEKMQLGKVLNEISGITYYEEGNSLLAISDSKEKIFEIKLKSKKLKDFTGKIIAPDSDLEDLIKVDTMVYLLSSPGILRAVPLKAKDSSLVQTYSLDQPGRNDFESLYYDPSVNGIILLCKTCADEKGQQIRTAYRFDLASKKFDSTAFYTISKQDVENVLKDKDAKFDPSAAAINPINKRLYILSSAGSLLVITDTKSRVIEVYHLNPDTYPQAEGIAFASNGDMYITNEGKYGKPTLLYLPYHQSSKKNK